jgi:hypothetical protein
MTRQLKGALSFAVLLACGGGEAVDSPGPAEPAAQSQAAGGRYYTATFLDRHFVFTICAESLTVRSMPERNAPVLCTLYQGETLQISHFNEDERWVYGSTYNATSCGTSWGWIENGYFCR